MYHRNSKQDLIPEHKGRNYRIIIANNAFQLIL